MDYLDEKKVMKSNERSVDRDEAEKLKFIERE